VAIGVQAEQANVISNKFFGFEYVLEPLAIKWACGGEKAEDIRKIHSLIDAHPQDAEAADLQVILDEVVKMSTSARAIEAFIPLRLTAKQKETLCAAALPLSIHWLEPTISVMETSRSQTISTLDGAPFGKLLKQFRQRRTIDKVVIAALKARQASPTRSNTTRQKRQFSSTAAKPSPTDRPAQMPTPPQPKVKPIR
jgi:hypothetical protein